MKRLLLILLLLSSTLYGRAQQSNDSIDYISLSGKILDEQTEPIIGVAIYIGDGRKVIAGCVTDYDGLFSIQVPALDSYSISLKYTGYHQLDTTLYRTDNLNDLHFRLKQSSQLIEDIRICGGGYYNRSIWDMLSDTKSDQNYFSGQVTDEHQEPIINALVELLDSNNTVLQTTNTDYDGEYLLQVDNSNITYKIMVRHVDYTPSLITNVRVTTNDTVNQNFKLRRQEGYQEIIINTACPSIIDRDNPSPMNKTFSSHDINRLAH